MVGDALIKHGDHTLELETWLGAGATSLVFWAQARRGAPGYVAKLAKEALPDLMHEWDVLNDLQPAVAEGAAIPQAIALCQDARVLLMLPRCQQLTPEFVGHSPA